VSGLQVKLTWPSVGVATAGSATVSATYFSSSQLQVSATFGNDPATWTAQVIIPGGITSPTYGFPLQAPFPVIQSLSQNSANAGGPGFTLTVYGSTFDQSSVVRWNGANLTTTPTVSGGGLTTALVAQVPSSDIASAGTATITVYTPSPGGGTSSGTGFSIIPTGPIISGVSPNPITGANSAQAININGSGFVSGAQVKLTWPAVGLAPAGSATLAGTFVSSSQLQVSATFGNDPATWTAQVINPGNVSSSAFNFPLQAPVPVILGLSQNSISGGAPGFTLTVNGSTFNQSSVVRWNGTDLTTVPILSAGGLTTALKAEVPSTYITAPGNIPVTVFTPSPGGGVSGPANFTISPNSPPAISGIFPQPLVADASDAYQTVTINGANFVTKPTLTLTWTGQSGYTVPDSRVTFVTASQITMSIRLGASADDWTVKVTNPDGQSSSAFQFHVNPPGGTTGCTFADSYPYPAANIYNAASPSDPSTIDPWSFYNRECTSYVAWKLNQSAGTTISPYFFYNLMGGGHWGDAGNWSANASALGYQVNTTPAVGAVAQWNPGEPGGGTLGHVAYVEAVNPDGTVAVSEYNYHLDHNFDLRCTVTPPRFLHIHDGPIVETPVISGLTPNPLVGSNSKQTVSVNGSWFVNGSQVKLTWPAVGVAPAGSATLPATFISSAELQISPTFGNDPATWTAQVINSGNVTSAPFNFQLHAPVPTIQLLSPNSAQTGSPAFTLTVNGSTFDQGSVVYWNGMSVPTTPVVSSGGLTTALQAQVPASDVASPGTATVTVFNPGPGGGTSAGVSFTIGPQPTTSKGVDYASNPPDPSALNTEGYSFVVRYVGGSTSKDITAHEAQALQAAGLEIIIVFEDLADQMLSGYNQGVLDANTAVAQATAAGAPPNFFCYFACDFDAQPSDQTAINAYLDGAASVLGLSRVGFYGGYGPVQRVLDAAKAAKAWQTTAWSAGNIDPRISLYQYLYNQTAAGGSYDVDQGFGNDLGQWGVPNTRIISLSGALAFGSISVGTTTQGVLTIANTGNSQMTVTSISYPAGFSGAWSGTVPAHGSQSVPVTFSPSAATTYGGNLTVNADQTSGQNSYPLSGTGTPNPAVNTVQIVVNRAGSVGLSMQGTPGGSYAVQVSTDMRNWTFLTNTTATDTGVVAVEDSGATSFKSRFYRISKQ
jgi:surface antigen